MVIKTKLQVNQIDDLKKLPYCQLCGWPAKTEDIPGLFERRFGYEPKIAYRYGNIVYVRVEDRGVSCGGTR